MSALALAAAAAQAREASPFDLDDDAAYRRWRDAKLAACARSVDELIVDLADPLHLRPAEREALLARLARTNIAVYRSAPGALDAAGVRRLGAQLGLHRLDAHWLADEDGVSRITVSDQTDGRGGFIPYTERPIRWHTDGYYNPPGREIRAMLLHCVSRAGEGGTNRLLDHELAYLMLRDADPAHVRALMLPDAMTIPARLHDDRVARAAQTGPVFSVDAASGALHMRYTARTRSIEWKRDPAVLAAVAALESVLAADSPHMHRVTLAPGMGILCNNVLHDRTGFTDDPDRPRLLYRARYRDRIQGT